MRIILLGMAVSLMSACTVIPPRLPDVNIGNDDHHHRDRRDHRDYRRDPPAYEPAPVYRGREYRRYDHREYDRYERY